MQLDLTTDEVNWINEKVANGEYESPDALISAALNLSQERESEEAETVQAIKEGIASFERGEGNSAREALTGILQRQDAEEKELVAAGLMRLPPDEKNDDFLNMPAPQVKMNIIQKTIREERDEK